MLEVVVQKVKYKTSLLRSLYKLTSVIASFTIRPEEPQLFLGYLAAEGSGDDTCLHKAACSSPELATEYIKAAKAILNTAETLDAEMINDLHYRDIIQKTERAILEGMSGAPCDIIYHCRI